METEEEEKNSNPSTGLPSESIIMPTAITATDTNTKYVFPNTDPQCEPEPDAKPQPLSPSPASATEITVPYKREDQDVIADLEAGRVKGESQQSPPALSQQTPAVGTVQPVQGVGGREEGVLIGGEESDEVIGDLAVKDKGKDVNNEVENESEEVVAAGIAEEAVAETVDGEIETRMAVEAVSGINDDLEEHVIDEKAVVVEEMKEKEEEDDADLVEEGDAEEVGEDKFEKTEAAEAEAAEEETVEAVNEAVEMGRMEMPDVAEEKDKEEDINLADVAEEAEDINEAKDMEIPEEGEDTNEAEEVDKAEETEGAEEEAEEVTRSAGGKRKRRKNARAVTKVTSKKKVEEDVCFICFDGGELVLCDRRGCPKAYHPACVNRDEAFFRAKGRWNCGWHLCSNCEKNAYYMCYTCTFSLCKGCIKDALILCVRGNKGFCEICMKTVMLIESNGQGNNGPALVDFNDKSSWEYLFKDYWIDLKESLSLAAEELAHAKNPWKGFDLHAEKQELPNEIYDAHNGGSGSGSSGNTEVTTSTRRKTRKRLESHAKEKNSLSRVIINGDEGDFIDGSVDWASKELLEFVMHMKNGDKSVCSQFDVQALLLEYIKKNKLRDPHRKSQIICDSRLENLFRKPRVGHFEMLKLLESHFLLKDDSQADDLQGGIVDTEPNQLEADENSDGLTKTSKDRRPKSRRKGDRSGLQSNIDDYAAIDMHNINLIYLRRSLVENLLEDAEALHDKAAGSFVRIRISGSAQKQDLYRLVQVIGTNKAAEPYRVGKRNTDFMLEILNLNKTEVISMDIISNQDFTEDECKRLRQSIKCGLINPLTVGYFQEKAMALQAVRVKDLLETEITRLSHLRDRASDLGRRKELRECVEKLQLLKSPEERQRRMEEIPEIHADPKMDPSYESEEEDETDEKRQGNHLRPRGSGFRRRGRDPISPGKGSSALNDLWGTRNHPSMNRELSRNMSNKGFLNNGDGAIGVSDTVNENLWSQGREKEAQQLQTWEKMKTAPNSETHSGLLVELSSLKSVRKVTPEIFPARNPAQVTKSAVNVNEAEKIWHYQDPSGKIQGPFSILQLRKWNYNRYFPADLRIWKTTEKQDDSILLTDALDGNFQKDPPSEDASFLKAQLVHGLQMSSLPSGNTGDTWKPQHEISYATGPNTSTPLEVPKYSTDKWGSGTNLPSPTPGQNNSDGTKKNVYESKWSPTPAANSVSPMAVNSFSGGNSELQRPAVVIPQSDQLSSTKLSAHIGGTNTSHATNSMPKSEPGMFSTYANAHSQSLAPSESLRVQQVTSHLLPAPDISGASVNATVDAKSLQNLVQPVSNNNPLGTHGWGANSISKSDVKTSQQLHAVGSQAWGSTSSQKLETNNSVSMSSQVCAYGNWGDATTSTHNSTSSFGPGNQTGVSPMPSTSVVVPSDPWRAPVPGQQNIQPSTPSNVPWGMAIIDNQGSTPRQGPENQNTCWTPIPGNSNMSWGGPLPTNSNQGWVAPGRGPISGSINPGWVTSGPGQEPGKANAGWVAPVQGQAPGNAFQVWAPVDKGPAPVNANPAWAAPGNANPNWPQQPTGNVGTRGSEMNHNGDRFSSQKDRGSQGLESGGKSWNRQSSFGRGGDSSRLPYKGQRVCKYHESGHCKKGASCDYLHT